MRKPIQNRFSSLLPALLALLFLAGCASKDIEPWSPDPALFEPLPTATPVEMGDVAEEESGKSPSFFGRLFRRKPPTDPALSADPATGSDASSSSRATPTPAAPSSVYRLKAGDAIFITLSGSLGVNEQIETQVDERGFVKLRYIGSVRAEGRSATELEREIEAEYTDRQNIYKEIYARVVLPNTFYFIGGEVRQPGRFPLVGSVSLSQAVVSAGNFTEWANPRRIVIVRNNERMEIDFRSIRDNPSKDVELRAGDVITVERSTL